MKLKLEKVNGYIILVDENAEIENGELYFYKVTQTIQKALKDDLGRLPKKEDGSYKAVFASLELNFDLPIIPDLEQFEIEQTAIKEVKRLDELSMPNKLNSNEFGIATEWFKIGHNHNKAVYTEEDLINIWKGEANMMRNDFFNKLKSLKKHPTYIIVESESIYLGKECGEHSSNSWGIYEDKPKLNQITPGGIKTGIIKGIIY